ncbi:HIT domain-containing protein [Pseudobacteriovorax antillogorgiicola]|uniref:Diadenosine tetraphosphate (Ap4A) hydrolase n=1 Tax=Pseudobacteriovorax antillogorgiicola TaxID=1513793 RepID=A0A1Y6BH56_9BACT|nr:HIT domain-containing protein [Pseudobacteriovorax antillogorgiicola]TCS57269.1 diadenosine tetraphosphate (Ap4A) HIT family hydrolase [Pseudobacteriovorax antillogorgiicola]SMF03228.1 Diadenosine tetraphosphate (Ap4A) hydrolase [Pseudobacteriovorax antillogorgiicola]
MTFVLDPQLEKDCHHFGKMKLCQVLLMNDRQYPWFILVPERDGVREIYQLERDDQISFLIESNLLSKALEGLFKPDKLNVAALGNVVPQLHIHHIVRYKNDACWPKPVWGQKPPVPYAAAELEELKQRFKEAMGANFKPRLDN